MPKNPPFKIDDKYLKEEGKIILTGLQALIRIPIDQYLADQAKGLNTATFISGYRGSPLGAIDLTLQSNKQLLDKYNISYVYIGPLERERYAAPGLKKFEFLMDVVFQEDDVTIYRRR